MFYTTVDECNELVSTCKLKHIKFLPKLNRILKDQS